MEEDEIPGLLVLLDFEKAFDTIEWEFIQRALKFLVLAIHYVLGLKHSTQIFRVV